MIVSHKTEIVSNIFQSPQMVPNIISTKNLNTIVHPLVPIVAIAVFFSIVAIIVVVVAIVVVFTVIFEIVA